MSLHFIHFVIAIFNMCNILPSNFKMGTLNCNVISNPMYYHYIEEELNFSLMKFTISILKEIRPMQRTIIRRLYQIEVEILDF